MEDNLHKEKISANHRFDKSSVSRLKNFHNSTRKRWIKKIGKGLNILFQRKYTSTLYPMWFVTKKLKIKTTVRCHFTHTRMAIIAHTYISVCTYICNPNMHVYKKTPRKLKVLIRVSIWRNRNSSTLLLEIQNGAAIVQYVWW